MGRCLRILIYNLSLLIILGGVLESCSHSKKGVMGSRKRKSHSMASRHQGRDFEERKKTEKKSEERTEEQQSKVEKDASDQPSTVINITESVTPPVEEKAVPAEVIAEATPEPEATPEITASHISAVASTYVATETTTRHVLLHTEAPAATTSQTTVSATNEPVIAEDIATTSDEAVSVSPAGKQENKKAIRKSKSESTHNASGQSSGNGWIVYFAITQAFLALVIGLKQTFSLLDTPSDAGNKALPISYATIGLLGIHAIVVIAMVKNFIL